MARFNVWHCFVALAAFIFFQQCSIILYYQNGDLPGNPLESVNILMAKTISSKDIEHSIEDIKIMSYQRFNSTHNIKLKWILFCFEEHTHNIIKEEMLLFNTDNVKIIYSKNKLKHYFWQTYLVSDKLTDLFADQYNNAIQFDYIWLLDGDIIIKDMNWKCFWFYVDSVYKPAIFQPSIINVNNHYPTLDEKHFHTTVFPLMCNNKDLNYDNNNIHKVFGIETQFVEIQTPIFRMEAWNIFIQNLNEKFMDYIESRSDWGSDYIWCNMINDKLLNQSKESVYNQQYNQWENVMETCHIEIDPNYSKIKNKAHIPCMIIHATPVKHLDTKTHPVHDENGETFKEGYKQIKILEQLFPEYYDQADHRYWRVFELNNNLMDCTSCIDWECTMLNQKK